MKYEVECQNPISKKLISIRLGTPIAFRHEITADVFLVSSVSYLVRKEGYISCYHLKSGIMYQFEEGEVVFPLSTPSTATFKYLSNEIQFKELT